MCGFVGKWRPASLISLRHFANAAADGGKVKERDVSFTIAVMARDG